MKETAFMTLLAVSLSSSLLGVPLILRNLGLLSAGLAHALLGAVAIASVTGSDPLFMSVLYTVIMGNLIYFISRRSRVSGDIVTAIFFTSGVALGVVLLGISESGAEDLHHAIVGDLQEISPLFLYLSLAFLLLTVLFLFYFRGQITLFGFSEEISRVYGVNTSLIGFLLVTITSLLVVLAIRTVGILLASSLFIIPAMSALLVFRGMVPATFASGVISLLSVISGYTAAEAFRIPPSGVIVITLLLLFSALYILSLVRKRSQ